MVNVEPAPVEVVVINGEEEALPAGLFAGVRDAYGVSESGIEILVTMLNNDSINLFNFIFIVELDDGDIFYSEPNAEREDGRITVKDNILIKMAGSYTVSLFYYGEDDVQITKHRVEIFPTKRD